MVTLWDYIFLLKEGTTPESLYLCIWKYDQRVYLRYQFQPKFSDPNCWNDEELNDKQHVVLGGTFNCKHIVR
jgi:hypothetical protein